MAVSCDLGVEFSLSKSIPIDPDSEGLNLEGILRPYGLTHGWSYW